MAHVGCSGRGGAIPLRPNSSDINLFRYDESVVDLNPQVAHRTFNFLVSQRVGFILRVSFLIENQRHASFGVSGRDGLCRPVNAARSAALMTKGAPRQTCRPLMSPRRSMRSAVILQTPMILAAPPT